MKRLLVLLVLAAVSFTIVGCDASGHIGDNGVGGHVDTH